MTERNDSQSSPESASRTPDLRALLIRAALEILADTDVPLDLRKVAERAGKSRTAPYLVFGKERDGGGLVALRLAVAAEGLRRALRKVTNATADAADPVSALHRWAEAFFDFAIDHPRLFRLMFGPEIGVARAMSEVHPLEHVEFQGLAAARTELERSVMQLVEWAQDQRLLPDTDVARQTMAAWAMLQGIALLPLDDVLHLAGDMTTPAMAADLATEAILRTTPRALDESARFLLEALIHKGMAPAYHVSESAGEYDVSTHNSERDEAQPDDYDDDYDDDDIDGDSAMQFDMVASAPMAPAPAPSPRESGPLDADIQPVLRRALAAGTALSGARILWIDDNPGWIEWERRVLERLGAHVTVVADTGAAVDQLQREPADVILSDIVRGGDPQAGITALPQLHEAARASQGRDARVIFYVGDLDESQPSPAGSAGITNRPDDLLHLVLDVLERVRG